MGGVKAKRPRSTRYVARSNPRRYLLSGIPPTLWDRARAQARREHVSMRTLLLSLLEGWLARATPLPPATAALLADIQHQYARRNDDYRTPYGQDLPDRHELTLYLAAQQIRAMLRESAQVQARERDVPDERLHEPENHDQDDHHAEERLDRR